MRGYILLVVLFWSLTNSNAQSCLVHATPQFPGYCNDLSVTCDQKNFNVSPDYKTDYYDYKIVTVEDFAIAQKFGSLSSDPADFDSLDLQMLVPVNSDVNRPVIVYSPLSSFTNSNTKSLLAQYIGAYFAKKGFLFLSFESRTFSLDYNDIIGAELTDFISNSYYTSDSNTLAHFRYWRDSVQEGYGFFQLISSLSNAAESDQLITDAYYEMMYKNATDAKILLSELEKDKNILGADMNHVFVLGGSAGSVQMMNASFLDNPANMDSELTSDLMSYKGLNFPHDGDLSADFSQESVIEYDIKPKGVINLWGRLNSLAMIDEDDPAVFSVHGTWDDIFPYQDQASKALPDVIKGYGAEGIFLKAKEVGLNSTIVSICKGGHTLFPDITTGCVFTNPDEEAFFDSLMGEINDFTIDLIMGINNDNEVMAIQSPSVFLEPSNFSLKPSPTANVTEASDLCPINYPEDFNKILYGLETTDLGGSDEEANTHDLNFQLYSFENLYPAFVYFELEHASEVDLLIFDMQGRQLNKSKSYLPSGPNTIEIDWVPTSPGMFQIVLHTSNARAVERMIIVD